MALINHNKKFMFFHLYKCGGTSVRRFIADNTIDTIEVHTGHALPIDMKRQMEIDGNPQAFDEYFKFTFIRNPFDFIVSTYFYAKYSANHFMHKDIVGHGMNIEKFIPYYMQHRENDIAKKDQLFGQNRVVTIKDWLLDSNGSFLVNHIGKVETIDRDMALITNRLGIGLNEVPKENVNANRDIGYRQYYSGRARKMIEKHFEWELDVFEYEF